MQSIYHKRDIATGLGLFIEALTIIIALLTTLTDISLRLFILVAKQGIRYITYLLYLLVLASVFIIAYLAMMGLYLAGVSAVNTIS